MRDFQISDQLFSCTGGRTTIPNTEDTTNNAFDVSLIQLIVNLIQFTDTGGTLKFYTK